MSLVDRIAPHLPYLRRFARAMTGSQSAGDRSVAELLQNLIDDPTQFDMSAPARAEAFRLLCKALGKHDSVTEAAEPNSRWEREASKHLQPIPVQHRLAFLLKSVEGLSTEEICHVLGESRENVRRDIDSFAMELADELATDVLVIEDEPIIAMEIEELVRSLGHRITGTARTHAEAVAIVSKSKPGLILADIQLADGSSGIEAVNEILASFDLPVIFITAYPERLLTGARPEPAFLIAKPFQPEMVKAIISQALFFNEQARAPGTAAAAREAAAL
jgi:CheY-like chemotaxis protein/DNA-directed RNA polymerase specialized sigma24 family protein